MVGRYALIIATDDYQDAGLEQLVSPAADAAALSETLSDPAIGDYEVQVLHNQRAHETMLGLEDFFSARGPGDLVVVHASCHGLKSNSGELYLAATDTLPTRLASTSIPAAFLNQMMTQTRARSVALFLDCCYGGAFTRGVVMRAGADAHVRDAFASQERSSAARGRVVITASGAIQYAFENGRLQDQQEPRPSVFTGALVHALRSGEADRDGDGWVGLHELFEYVADRVRRATPNQTPHLWTFGSQGEMRIARSAVRRVIATPLSPQIVEAIANDFVGTRLGVIDLLRDRVMGDDLGQALAAWEALGTLTDDDSRRVSTAAERARAEVALEAPSSLTLREEPTVVTLTGAPIARAVTARCSATWLKVEHRDDVLTLTAVDAPPGDHDEVLTLTGPITSLEIPVHVSTPQAVLPSLEPQRSVTPPTTTNSMSGPASSAEPADLASPETNRAGNASPRLWRPVRLDAVRRLLPRVGPVQDRVDDAGSALSRSTTGPSWGTSLALIAIGVLLTAIDWPDRREFIDYPWKYGAFGYNSLLPSYDGHDVASLLILLSGVSSFSKALADRLKLGGVAGGAAALLLATALVDWLSTIGLGQYGQAPNSSRWVVTALLAAGVLWLVTRAGLVRVPTQATPALGGAALVLVGVVLVGLADTFREPPWIEISRGMSLLFPGVLLVIALMGVIGSRSRGASNLIAASLTFVALAVLNTVIVVVHVDQRQQGFLWCAFGGYALVAIGLLWAAWRARVRL